MRQRGDSWQLRVFAGYDAVTGKKRWITKTVPGGKREAQRALAGMVTEVDHGMSGTDATVAVLLERWFEVASPDWSPKTVVSHRSIINNHLTPRLGAVQLRKLRAADLDRLYAALRKLPGRRDATLATSTIRRIHVVVHAALEQAVKWGWLALNPADAATPPKVLPAVVTPPAAADVARLLDDIATREPDLFAYLSIAVSTGARRSQMCGLQWGDLNLDTGSLLFCRGVVHGPDGVAVKRTKSNRPYRVSLDPDTMSVVREHHQRMTSRAELCGVGLSPGSFMFTHAIDGLKPWRPDLVTHRWERLRRRAGLDQVRLHDLRHFTATSMLAAGVPLTVVSGRLGHSRGSTTLNVYAHFVDAGDRAAAATMGAILKRARDEG